MKLGLAFQKQRLKSQFFPCLLSLFVVVISQFALAMVPRLFPSFSFPSILSISALVLLASAAFGRCCRRVLHVSASAPAVVFFNILFIWGVYVALIREGISFNLKQEKDLSPQQLVEDTEMELPFPLINHKPTRLSMLKNCYHLVGLREPQ